MAELENGGKRRRYLTMEEYLDFFDSRGQLNLSYDKLNQIIAVHGFRKLQTAPKTFLVEAVSKLDLINPMRSTKQDDGVSPLAPISLKEALSGIQDLDWQECHVSSVVTLNALVSGPSEQRDAVPAKRKRMRKKTRKLVRVRDLINVDESTSDGTTVAAAGTNDEDNETLASLFARVLRKSVPTKKRSRRVEFRGCTKSSAADAGDVGALPP